MAVKLITPPLSLYVHIPWCVRKCPYCDFNSHEAGVELNESTYIEALINDLDDDLEKIGTRELQSIFIGGGTPSLFSAGSIRDLIAGIKQRMQFSPDIEITLEANPGTFEQKKFADFYSAGVNRLSIGIQSFNTRHLKTLGRIHDGDEAIKAINTANIVGFENINLDLMFALPQQNVQQAIDDITTAMSYTPTHISHYQLTIEPNTYFYKHTPELPDADTAWQIQTECRQLLEQNDYDRYEVSAFSQTGNKSRHNLNYWNFGDYIGIGAGAHGKITHTSSNIIERTWKHRQPREYIQQAQKHKAISGNRLLDNNDRLFEFCLNALRLRKGFTLDAFEQFTGLERNALLDACAPIDEELIRIEQGRVSASERGYDFLNEVLEQLLQAPVETGS